MGLHMGLESPHRKSFDPLHDLGAPLIHFDFSKAARTSQFPHKTDAGKILDNLASTGALFNNAIRLKTSYQFSTSTCPDAGIVLVNSEYFSYSGYSVSGSDVTTLNNVTRNIAGTQSAHSTDDAIDIVAGEYQAIHGSGTPGTGTGLRDFSNWTTNELQLKNEGSAGGYLEIPSTAAARPAGQNTSDLGQAHRACLTVLEVQMLLIKLEQTIL